MTDTILVVEDEATLGETLAAYLRKEGFNVELISDGAAVMPAFEQQQPVMILLDLMLPNIDGISLCRTLRQVSQVPIIILTARVDELDRLLGLEIGADDYVCKPYSPREVVARVKAVLRRCALSAKNQNNEITTADNSISASALVINEVTMEASLNGIPLQLTTVEFRLLSAMAGEPRRVFSRDQLMSKIYSDHRIVSDRTIDSHITKLRRKLTKSADGQDIIRSVYGAGYKFELPL